MAPRFSVLLPAHNRADVIGYAIASVLKQTERDFELLVVGDGCTDNTAEVVRGFCDPRIRWFDLPKAPFFGYANRNAALREAKGDLVAYLGHDDLLLPDHLAELGSCFEAQATEWAYSRPLWVSTDGFVVPFAVNLGNPNELQYFLTVRNSIPSCCVVHRRSCLEAYGYWPEDIPRGADWKLWIRIIEGGARQRLAFCRIPTALHFKADWRPGKTGFTRANGGVAAAEMLDWWPFGLKLEIRSGATEQQIFFETMTAGGATWVAALREATDDALDGLAWLAINTLIPKLRRRQAAATQLKATVTELRATVKRLERAAAKRSSGLARHLSSVKALVDKWRR
jgi:glycosyltransferase involved in cell wall biosynthesis